MAVRQAGPKRMLPMAGIAALFHAVEGVIQVHKSKAQASTGCRIALVEAGTKGKHFDAYLCAHPQVCKKGLVEMWTLAANIIDAHTRLVDEFERQFG